jgi:CRISPR system Cascade subunit CasE
MTSLYLSRARLRAARGETLSAVAPLLIPDDPKRQAGHAHRVLWLLFQDAPNTTRDFLWRDDGRGRYLILSRRPPSDPHGLFELDTKPFEPLLSAGDRLAFSLRANPVITTKRAGTKPGKRGRPRGTRVDVVMDALRSVPSTDWKAGKGRAFERDRIASESGMAWLRRQGERAGFKLVRAPVVDGYTQIPLERRQGRPAGFSVLNLKGEIEITDPTAFLHKLPSGFGSAKAFGCGLMLIRRA